MPSPYSIRRYRQRSAASPSAEWRKLPPTPKQLKVLRHIKADTGIEFGEDIDRGTASDAIAERFATNPRAARASRRARAKRRRHRASRQDGAQRP